MINVLIVDDEEEICDYLTDLLGSLGCHAAYALTGEEALQLFKHKKWHICVTDLKLSTEVSGLEVIREIKTRWPDTHVIAMTGYVDVELRQQSEKLGVDRFIEKPDGLNMDVFSQIINETMEKLK